MLFYVRVGPRNEGFGNELQPVIGGPFDSRKRATRYASIVRRLAKCRYELPISLKNEVIETPTELKSDISYRGCFEIELGRRTIESIDKNRLSQSDQDT